MFELVLTVGVLGFVGFRLAAAAGHSFTAQGRRTTVPLVRGIRWRHVWPAPLVLGVVIVVASVLVLIPGLSWGWWTAIGGEGNPVTGTTDQTAGTPLEWVVPLVFLCLLFVAIPLFALAEERTFRRGCESWSWARRVRRTIEFGLAHAIIGIPIGVALALSCGGAYFVWCYLRGYRAHHRQSDAVLESARAHAVYNAVIVVLVLTAIVLMATGTVETL